MEKHQPDDPEDHIAQHSLETLLLIGKRHQQMTIIESKTIKLTDHLSASLFQCNSETFRF